MTNINRARAGDEITLSTGEIYEIKEAWSAGGYYQFKVNDKDELILTVDINGKAVDNHGDIISLREIETEDDKITYYIPKFDVEFLPVLTVNNEDKIVYSLMDLNGIEVSTPQTLQATYKYVIVAMLQKKLGRDITVIKKQEIICQSKEDCEQRLFEISGNLKGANIDETETRKEFDELIEKVLTNEK